MNSLDRAIELVVRWKTDRQKQRAEILSRLEAVVKECQAALQVWQGYLAKPGAPGDQWTIMSWVGPDRAKQLHEINLRAKENLEQVSRMAGPEAGRFIGLEANVDVVEMAYRMLKPGETGIEAATSAAQRQRERMDYLQGLMQRLRSTKPGQKATSVMSAGSKVSAKKTAVKKAKPKNVARGAKKKAAPAKK
ncbi:MAG: hypothetical protein ACYC9L_08425 [Sulfuricaulis sp.]